MTRPESGAAGGAPAERRPRSCVAEEVGVPSAAGGAAGGCGRRGAPGSRRRVNHGKFRPSRLGSGFRVETSLLLLLFIPLLLLLRPPSRRRPRGASLGLRGARGWQLGSESLPASAEERKNPVSAFSERGFAAAARLGELPERGCRGSLINAFAPFPNFCPLFFGEVSPPRLPLGFLLACAPLRVLRHRGLPGSSSPRLFIRCGQGS